MLGTLEPRLQGELLQVHQRDAPRHGGHERQQRHQVPRRGQRHLRRRRLRAGAGLRRDLPGGRWQRVGVAAGDAAARRAARHRRADARGRQAQGAPRRGGSLQHADRGCARQARGGLALRRQGRAPPASSRRQCPGAGARAGGDSRTGRRAAPGILLGPLGPSVEPRRHPLQVRRRGDRSRQADLRSDHLRARHAAARVRRTSSCRLAISRGRCARSASWTTACCACA